MPYHTSDAPAAVGDVVARLEARADECWRTLKIRHLGTNVARWGILVGGVRIIEREHAARRANTPHFDAALINVGRLVANGLRWAINHGQPFSMPLRWTGELNLAVDQAIDTSRHYEVFEVCFQGFHAGHYLCDVVDADRIRFSVAGSGRDRQVSAYQKGIRPGVGVFARPRPDSPPQNAVATRAFRDALGNCRSQGVLRFECQDLWNVWRALLPEYRERVREMSRRPGDLSLGPYDIDDFNAFYAAFLAIAAANDFLCYQWQLTTGEYPLESAVLVWSRDRWADTLCTLAGIENEKCRVMISDMTFTAERSIDLHVHPFVPLDDEMIAVAPPLPLSSRHDENILRVCSLRRPQIYSRTSLEKQPEMLATIRRCSQFEANGSVKLPKPWPDIDLLVTDDPSSTLLVAELKWIRKPLRPAESVDRSAEVRYGIEQLEEIQRFLRASPDHLRAIGKLRRRVDEYQHVYYLLAARDHWCWIEPRAEIATVTFDALTEALAVSGSLHDRLQALLQYEWLPQEGRDFYVRNDVATVGDVSIESPVFYSTMSVRGSAAGVRPTVS